MTDNEQIAPASSETPTPIKATLPGEDGLPREGDVVLTREPFTSPASKTKKYGMIAVAVIAVVVILLAFGGHI
jgi:hypothetical protein